MKTIKIWHEGLNRYIDADYDLYQKVMESAKLRQAKQRESQPSFFQRFNIIELLFKLFVFTFIFLPLGAFCVAVLWWSFGMGFVYAVLIMFVLVVLCYLSQVPASQLSFDFAISTFIKAIVMTPIALVGSFFVAKAPKGTVGAGGIVADMVRDASEVIDKVKRQ